MTKTDDVSPGDRLNRARAAGPELLEPTREELIEALRACYFELRSIHLNYGDEANAEAHSAALRGGRKTLERCK